MLRLGSLASVACLLALAGGAAHGAQPRQATFRVTLTGTLTKTWTFIELDEEETECIRTTRGSGRWRTNVATRRAATVTAVDAGRGRIRFSGAVLRGLAGTALQSGSITRSAAGPPPCERFSRTTRCNDDRHTFRNAYASFASPRRGVVAVGRLRRATAIRFRSRCEGEPDDIAAARTDLSLARAPLDASDVFDRDVPRFFASADSEEVTTLEGAVAGRIVERVRWTLVFRRLR